MLKAVKWMIIVNGVVLHTSTSVAFFGAFNAPDNAAFAHAYKIIEKVQMTGFTLQEFIIPGLYIWRTLEILQGSAHSNKRVVRELLAINVLISFMDIALLIVEYQDRHVIEQALNGVVYSVGLKLEFAILSKLVSVTRRGGSICVSSSGEGGERVAEGMRDQTNQALRPWPAGQETEVAQKTASQVSLLYELPDSIAERLLGYRALQIAALRG
ncbi:hypothetical protein LTR37_006460 [Vermiconidia calcicola]|uniref:Uncharacterized protein n=1 Tax=Vermiconidia calcicola TaxID=1690605 RepID=A0ACC3NGP1_9PEZI|nr:hypothetical protein LTR37_006460 [Vermiconidia calcicola]